MTYADIPQIISLMIQEDPEIRSGMVSDVAMGLLFAALGVFAMLKKAGDDLSGIRVVDLE